MDKYDVDLTNLACVVVPTPIKIEQRDGEDMIMAHIHNVNGRGGERGVSLRQKGGEKTAMVNSVIVAAVVQ